MSRTDHHRPWQIRAADGVARKNNDPSYFRHDHLAHWWTGACGEGCGWTLPHLSLCQPPHWYITAVWNACERGRERNQLRALAVEYNTHGELADGDFVNVQHRHSAMWTWT